MNIHRRTIVSGDTEFIANHSDDSEILHNPLAVGLREYHGDPDIRENLAKELAPLSDEQDSKKDKKGFSLSLEDEKKIAELFGQKADTIQDISPKYQRRIRTMINLERKQRKLPEIHYHEIDPKNPSYVKRYAQLIVNKYNADIDHAIHAIKDQSIYEYELKKLGRCNRKQLQKKVKNIPREVQYEIIQSLDLNPQSITAQKKEVQQKIIAAFNAYY